MNYYTDNKVLGHYLRHPLMQRIVQMQEHDYTQADKYNYAPIDFDEAVEGYEQVLELIGRLCAEVIAPNATEVEADGPTLKDGRVIYAPATEQNLDLFRKAGLMGISLPREYGGLNFPRTVFILIEDVVTRADAAFGNLWGLQDCAETIHSFGSEEQCQRFLPRVCAGETMSMDLTEPDAGSDLQSVRLKASYSEADGCWYLDGVKRFITNGDSDIHLVLARSEEGSVDGRGLSLFVVEKSCGAVHTRRIEDKMGIHGSPTCEIVFNHARAELIGSRRMGLIKYVMALMNGARLGIATQSVGLAQAAYSEALAYARSRKQFGKAIINFPAVYDLVGGMKARLDAARSLLYETSRNVDMSGQFTALARERTLTPEERAEAKIFAKKADALTPIIKGIGSEIANLNAYDCVQVHGGSGYMRDYVCERIYRDARITSIYEGTTQLQVVAAIRYATSGFYGQLLDEYLAAEVPERLAPLHGRIAKMAADYKAALEKAQASACQESLDFLSRRLYEMAAYTIMAALLLADAAADEELFASSLNRFVAMAEALVAGHAAYIEAYTPELLQYYEK
ncbi:MAG: acyl-CoA dehydrogenase family protein [Bacteroidaceae bacterium]|nr:acyl-CoA dehydrogenase family protein [Bacteroidaceae bacterium]